MEFKQQLASYQKIIEQELTRKLPVQTGYAARLNAAIEYSLMGGGKRLRPALVMASYLLFREDVARCLPYAIAIEMVHNFSLIHDDLPGIDNDDFRHGKPTNHKQFDEATAILAGDALLNQAYMVISDDLAGSDVEDLPLKIQIFQEFAQAVDKMAAGEYVDTLDEGKNITAEELDYIHNNKTGALLTLAVRMGAILGRADDRDLANLTNYAIRIGLAYQIKDDILSEEGDEHTLGKPVGNDRAMGKCTYVSQYGLAGAKEALEAVSEQAIECLASFGSKADFLRQLVDYIKSRNK